MIKDFFLLAFFNIKHRQVRSWLTIIGIIIGVAAIVALLSLSQGLQNAIFTQFEKLGGNKIMVMPKSSSFGTITQGLTTKDVDTIEKLPEVDWVLPLLFISGGKVEYKKEEIYISVVGVETKDLEKKWHDMDIKIVEGSLPTKETGYDAVLGYKVWNKDLFDKKIRVGDKIIIKDVEFNVKGLIEEIGSTSDDSQVYIPLDLARQLFDRPTEVTMIQVQVKKGVDIDNAAAKITRKLKSVRNDENFDVLTPEQTMKILQNVTMILTIFLGGIAAISLLVGGVGIMNSMYTNVLERTREIGVMKAIGARNSDVLSIFMIEAGFIGFVGGVIGTGFGFLIAKIVEFIAKGAGFGLLLIKPTLWVFALGILFAISVSILAGYFPARQAAKLKPVDALRY